MAFVACPKLTGEETAASHVPRTRAPVVGPGTGSAAGPGSCGGEAWRRRPAVVADVGGHVSAPSFALATRWEGPFSRQEK